MTDQSMFDPMTMDLGQENDIRRLMEWRQYLDERNQKLHEAEGTLKKFEGDLKQYEGELKRESQTVDGKRNDLEQRLAQQAQMPTPQPSQLGAVLDRLAGQIGMQNLSEIIKPFGGNPKELPTWIKNIEKHSRTVNGQINDKECVQLAYRTSRYTVSDFLGRFLATNPTWDTLKKELENRFGERVDKMTKFDRLKKYGQRHDQGIQVFAEIILGKASEIFSAEELKFWTIEKELISIFVKGLKNKGIGRRVLSRNPQTLTQAALLANEASETTQRLKVHGLDRREEEDMDVTEVSERSSYHKPPDRAPSNFRSTAPRTPPRNELPNKWEEGKPVCNQCKKIGHMFKVCPDRPRINQQRTQVSHRQSRPNHLN